MFISLLRDKDVRILLTFANLFFCAVDFRKEGVGWGWGVYKCRYIAVFKKALYRGSQPVLRGALRAPHALPRGSTAAPGK